MEGGGAVIRRISYDLELIVSKVTKVQLDVFHVHFRIPSSIMMRVPTQVWKVGMRSLFQ